MMSSNEICAVCGNSNCKIFAKELEWSLFECDKCGLLFKNGNVVKYDELDLSEFQVFDYDRSLEVDEIWDAIKPNYHNYSSCNIIEIGFGTGAILKEFQNRGAKVFGFEPSQVSVDHAKIKYGLTNITHGYFKNNVYKVKPNVFLLIDVIEHLENPKELIKDISQAMDEESILVVKTGDSGSFNANIFKQRWKYIYKPQHKTFYNRKTMDYLGSETNLRVIRFIRNKDAYGGVSWKKLIKNIVKGTLLKLTTRYKYLHLRYMLDEANDHFIAVLSKVPKNEV